jgi:hypothetical protein
MDACRGLGLPMIVHFHGFDVHSRAILDRYGARYRELFDQAAALIVVSRPMREALLTLGAPACKTHYCPNPTRRRQPSSLSDVSSRRRRPN